MSIFISMFPQKPPKWVDFFWGHKVRKLRQPQMKMTWKIKTTKMKRAKKKKDNPKDEDNIKNEEDP